MLTSSGLMPVYLCSRNNGVWLLGKGLKAWSSKLDKSVAAVAAAAAAAAADVADSLVDGWSDVLASLLLRVFSDAVNSGSGLIVTKFF